MGRRATRTPPGIRTLNPLGRDLLVDQISPAHNVVECHVGSFRSLAYARVTEEITRTGLIIVRPLSGVRRPSRSNQFGQLRSATDAAWWFASGDGAPVFVSCGDVTLHGIPSWPNILDQDMAVFLA